MKKIECRLRYKHPQEMKLISALEALNEFESLNHQMIQWAIVGYYEIVNRIKKIDLHDADQLTSLHTIHLSTLQIAQEVFTGTGYETKGDMYIKEMLRIIQNPPTDAPLIKRTMPSRAPEQAVALGMVTPAPESLANPVDPAPTPEGETSAQTPRPAPWGKMSALCGVDD